MRAILIDAYKKAVTDIELPKEVNGFQQALGVLLKTDQPKIIHSNEILTVILDEEAHWKDTPAFFSPLMEEVPMFGNIICIGRNPITKEMEDLYEEFECENFIGVINWCDPVETLRYRQIVRDFARTNRT
jgi:hypothetical protein